MNYVRAQYFDIAVAEQYPLIMQTPISPELINGGREARNDRFAIAPSVPPLSVESQLKIRALYEYVEACRTTLNDIRRDLSFMKSCPECSGYAKKASERLKNLCLEADSWGFNSFYQISMRMQSLLLDSGGRQQEESFWNALNRGWSILWALLEQC
jgi:hypothetical protein